MNHLHTKPNQFANDMLWAGISAGALFWTIFVFWVLILQLMQIIRG
jgi:hypothetical protein